MIFPLTKRRLKLLLRLRKIHFLRSHRKPVTLRRETFPQVILPTAGEKGKNTDHKKIKEG